MARVLLAQGEDLIARFRPHPSSYVARYLRGGLWLGYGLLAWWFHNEYDRFEGLGLVSFAVLAAAHATTAAILKRPGLRAGATASGASLAAAALLWMGVLPGAGWAMAWAPLMGLAVFLLSVLSAEIDRTRRVHHVTTKRILVRRGLVHVTERTIPLDRVAAVEGSQGGLGQLFGCATLTLTFEADGRRRRDAPPVREHLRGVPRWEWVKQRLETSLEELHLPAKERTRRLEERRLRDSMHAVAQWIRSGHA